MDAVHGGRWRVLALGGFVIVGVAGIAVFDDWNEPRMVREAVLNVAPGGSSSADITVANVGRFSSRTTLWCSVVPGGAPGDVAVLVRKGRKQFISSIEEVAPAWVNVRTEQEAEMLAECARRTGSRPAALP